MIKNDGSIVLLIFDKKPIREKQECVNKKKSKRIHHFNLWNEKLISYKISNFFVTLAINSTGFVAKRKSQPSTSVRAPTTSSLVLQMCVHESHMILFKVSNVGSNQNKS